MRKLIFLFLILSMAVCSFVACGDDEDTNQNNSTNNGGDDTNHDTPSHSHIFVEGKCECGEEDPTYEPPHEHTPAEAVKENETASTCDKEGSYDEVVYCSACGAELSREGKITEMVEHTPAEAVKENEIASTCDKEGSYDEVVYCSACGAELSREGKITEMVEHTPAEAVKENEIASTCDKEGSYDEVVYCSACGAELSREGKITEMVEHSPAEAVKENETASTCDKEGSYDEVVYCSVCSEELSRNSKTTTKAEHTPAEAIIENNVDATCFAEGSYDEVVYCSVCNEELSRNSKTTTKLEHIYSEGKCTNCGAPDPDYVPPHEHHFVDGICECGEVDPEASKPEVYDTYQSFEEMPDGDIPTTKFTVGGLEMATHVQENATVEAKIVSEGDNKYLLIDKIAIDTNTSSQNWINIIRDGTDDGEGGYILFEARLKISVTTNASGLYLRAYNGRDAESNGGKYCVSYAIRQSNGMLTYNGKALGVENGAWFSMRIVMSADNGFKILIKNESGRREVVDGISYANGEYIPRFSVASDGVSTADGIVIMSSTGFIGGFALDYVSFGYVVDAHEHHFVDGICDCGAEDPNYDPADEPDYGNATVYQKGSRVYLVGDLDEIDLVEYFASSLADKEINLIYNETAEKKYEIIVGGSVQRDVVRVAYELLEALPKSSYFNARYLVYASSGKIVIAYDYNEYTPISVLEYINDALVQSIIGDGEFVALPEGIVTSGSVDLIEEQRKLDDIILDEAWENLKKTVPSEIYEAFRTLYTMYDDKLIEWYASLYDPNVGAYYETSSQRNSDGYLPEPEATIQAMRFLESSGMLSGLGKYQDNIPEIMKHKIVYYCKSIQDPNGYFYNPQYGKYTSNGRDLSWCTQMLAYFGSAPVYDTPNGYKGDGITADVYWDSLGIDEPRPINLAALKESFSKAATLSLDSSMDVAVSKVIGDSNVIAVATTMDYLSDYRAYIDYLYSINVDLDPYTGCGYLNSTYTQVQTQSDVLYNKQGAFVFEESYGERYRMFDGMNLKEITIAYFNSKINPETGLCGKPSTINPKGTEYLFTNGFFKIISVYNSFGAVYPEAEKATDAIIGGLIGDEPSLQNICDIYNLWSGLSSIKTNVSKYADKETKALVLEKINTALEEFGAEAILTSYEKMVKYKMPDGGFASSTKAVESNVDAIGKPMDGMVGPMFSLLGATKIPMYTRHHLMQYFEILLSAEGIGKQYFKPLSEIFTFDELPDTTQLYLRSATADLSLEPGRNGDSALKIDKNVDKDQTIIDISLTQKVADPKGITFETDIRFSDVSNSNPIAIVLGPYNSKHNNRAYRFEFSFSKADGSKITMTEKQWNGVGTSFSTINTFDSGVTVGEWFNLRIEYDTTSLVAQGYPETRMYINDVLIYKTNEVYSMATLADDPSASVTLIMYTPVKCCVWLDNTVLKQVE